MKTFPIKATVSLVILGCLVSIAFLAIPIAAQNITTVAGGGVTDGVQAIATTLSFPRYFAIGPNGDLYISESFSSRIRRVDADGVITTVAGINEWTYSGDGGPATSAALNSPAGIAFDSTGRLLIADLSNHRIRRVEPGMDGIVNRGDGETITTIAGTGTAGYSGDGDLATIAKIQSPLGIFVGPDGSIYFAEAGNNVVRKIEPDGNITTVAGNGTPGFSGDGGPAIAATLNLPRNVLLDGSGDLYITDWNNRRIRKVDHSTGDITTIAGNGLGGASGDGGPATEANIDRPRALALDTSGNLLIASQNPPRVRLVNLSTGIITTVAGTGCCFDGDGHDALSTKFSPFLSDVAVDTTGNILLADAGNSRIRRIAAIDGIVTSIAGGGDIGNGSAATLTSLILPVAVTVDGLGNLYIAEQFGHRVRRVDPSGIITTLAGTGISGSGGDGGDAEAAELRLPMGVAVDTSGNVFIATSNLIRKVDTMGNIGLFAELDGHPTGMAFDPQGFLYVADDDTCVIHKVDMLGNPEIFAGTIGDCSFGGDNGPATAAQLKFPVAVALDSLGNLYIADQVNFRVRRVDPSGTITTVAGNGTCGFSGDGGQATSASLCFTGGVAADPLGNLYIADYFNSRVRKVDAFGTITTVAGTGELGMTGDGGLAVAARLTEPFSVATDSVGDLYIGDDQTGRVRKVTIINTPEGQDVPVAPTDSTTNTSPVSLTFSNVETGGTTTLATSTSGPAEPAGFSLGEPETFYDLNTTAEFTGTIEVCIDYSGVSFIDESALQLFHFDGADWVNVTSSLDTVNDIICGTVTSLSLFAILEPAFVAQVGSPINADGSSVFDANRGVVPVKFTLTVGGAASCQLPPATISLTRTAGAVVGQVNESDYLMNSDSGSNFRITDCQYHYNLSTSSLGPGTYRVDVRVAGHVIGSGVFSLK